MKPVANEKSARQFARDPAVVSTLTPEQYRVTQQGATEMPGSGEYLHNDEPGIYVDIVSGEPLFASSAKFDSGCGWPSFNAPASEGTIDEHEDKTYGMVRTEVTCARCGGHLGHVFPDGPAPTHLRYCINSASIDFDGSDK